MTDDEFTDIVATIQIQVANAGVRVGDRPRQGYIFMLVDLDQTPHRQRMSTNLEGSNVGYDLAKN